MDNGTPPRIVVGVDGSASSIEALKQAQRIAQGLGAHIEATACWEAPRMEEEYAAMGIKGFEERAQRTLNEALTAAYGPDLPGNVSPKLQEGSPRPTLIEASKNAVMLVLGRRGHGGFHGLLIGSVSSACIARAHCPVLVVHALPGTSKHQAPAAPAALPED
ncbi:universal stress protein [Arthrobacter ginkgonis]|uniref:Universal stress protein n=1 Tax=Arthrobacter ginkgonis TaxID=1630594 RepID=A0ABP7BR20_9MICC